MDDRLDVPNPFSRVEPAPRYPALVEERPPIAIGHVSIRVTDIAAAARAGGADALFLEVRPSNVVAMHLYDSLGFSEVGVRRDYYPSHLGNEDARVLVLDLDAYFHNPVI